MMSFHLCNVICAAEYNHRVASYIVFCFVLFWVVFFCKNFYGKVWNMKFVVLSEKFYTSHYFNLIMLSW